MCERILIVDAEDHPVVSIGATQNCTEEYKGAALSDEDTEKERRLFFYLISGNVPEYYSEKST